MCEEADSSAADGTVVAELGAVASGVQPVLEDVVSVGASFASDAVAALFHVWAGDACVGVGARVSAHCFFACTDRTDTIFVCNRREREREKRGKWIFERDSPA